MISVVLTSYNDKDIILPFFQDISNALRAQGRYAWELVYVDDGSIDGSVEVLKRLASKHPEISFIELARNFGQQKAFFAGMKLTHGDIVITLDGDYQYEPTCILDLADKIQEGFDLVSGIRKKRHDPIFSKLTSFIGQFFVRRALRYPVQDFGAVKAFSRFLVNQIIAHENHCVMPYGMAYALTSRITELPVDHRPRPTGRSKWNLTKRTHVFFDLYLSNSPYESSSLLKIGSYSTGIGFATLAILLYLFLAKGIFFFHSFTAITALILITGGIALIFVSFFLSFLLRIYRQLVWRGSPYVIRETHSSQVSAQSIKAL